MREVENSLLLTLLEPIPSASSPFRDGANYGNELENEVGGLKLL